jgi:hypothetical protein
MLSLSLKLHPTVVKHISDFYQYSDPSGIIDMKTGRCSSPLYKWHSISTGIFLVAVAGIMHARQEVYCSAISLAPSHIHQII